MGRHPTHEIIQTSYADSLATDNSRKARDTFVSREFSEVFPLARHRPHTEGQRMVAVERQAAHEWGTVQGGRYLASGILGGITGRGADILIIDDPVKNRQEANSSTMRKKVLDEYKGTLRTRLAPQGAVIIVMTRWHPGDLAGAMLQEMKDGTGEDWVELKLKGIDDDGNPLWGERYSIEEMRMIKKALGPYEWGALYDQAPVLRGGNRFNMDEIVIHDTDEHFPDCRYVRFWDPASSSAERQGDDPDYTAGALMGITWDGIIPSLWLKDVQAFREEAPARNRKVLATASRDGSSVQIGVESVGGYKDKYTTLANALKGVRTVIKVPVSGDKTVRATPIEAIMDAGNFHIVRAPWNPMFDEHFREFADGAHDDIVDSVSGGYAMLEKQKHYGTLDRRLLGM